jgi:hypothetical protein
VSLVLAVCFGIVGRMGGLAMSAISYAWVVCMRLERVHLYLDGWLAPMRVASLYLAGKVHFDGSFRVVPGLCWPERLCGALAGAQVHCARRGELMSAAQHAQYLKAVQPGLSALQTADLATLRACWLV